MVKIGGLYSAGGGVIFAFRGMLAKVDGNEEQNTLMMWRAVLD